MRAAVAQFTASLDPAANREAVAKLTAEAASAGAELVVFPEGAARDFGEPAEVLVPYAEPLDGPFVATLARLAREHRTVIVAGMFERVPDSETHVYNTVVAVGAGGDLLGSYRKLHLFDAFGFAESDRIQAGSGATLTFAAGGLTFGVVTCYDLRFPELARRLVDQGAEALLVPAAWVHGLLKEDHWDTLLRARAIENTCYVLGAGQVGGVYSGRSLIADPMGVRLAGLGEGQGVAVADLSPERVASVRAKLPSLRHRRFTVEPPR